MSDQITEIVAQIKEKLANLKTIPRFQIAAMSIERDLDRATGHSSHYEADIDILNSCTARLKRMKERVIEELKEKNDG